LEELGLSAAGAGIVRYFLLRPESRPHSREIQRVVGIGPASLQRELARLVSLDGLERTRDGNKVRYSMGSNQKLWAALALLVETTSDPSSLVEEALRDVEGVSSAFVFGSAARGEHRAGSDVDLLVVEAAELDRTTLSRRLAETALLLGRHVNAIRYTERALAERLGDPSHPAEAFVRGILTGPKRWVAGTPDRLLSLATAAGLSLPESSTA
jgi:predicted nucleotidyltransferase